MKFDDYYTTDEFAAKCGVKEVTVRQWINRGKLLSAEPHRGRWYIPKSATAPKDLRFHENREDQ